MDGALGSFFETAEGGESETIGSAVGSSKSHGKIPPSPRSYTNFCGISNQGATCYLNSLLQSLALTPEFREALFSLREEELGKLSDQAGNNKKKVRVIPLQLQRLFARLLLLNTHAVSTAPLTDSFGWTNSEELVQHDVQELSRILFSAVEQSLVGTEGRNLVKDLYHGSIVNQITCQTCGRCSERQEDFLDLCVAVWDSSGLEDGLRRSYKWTEPLCGDNKYFCDGCKKLSNAEKGAKLRHLPPILSISMLRFNFDPVKFERYKETGKFTFPHELDMAEYCENLSTAGDTEYELFSVIIHRGSTHGGHYHAYIRDVDCLGHWQHPEDTPIHIPTDPATGQVDFIECDNPVELVMAILSKMPGGATIDTLGAEILKQTGVSWNKRFKQKYGPINKFLKKYDDKFEFDMRTNRVKLRDYTSPPSTPHIVVEKPREKEHNSSPESSSRPRPLPPTPGHEWFNFDDSTVRPITATEIERQFSGKESAYMLFYRRKSLIRPREARRNVLYGMSEQLIQEIIGENEKLEKERAEYEMRVNSITLHIHYEQSFTYNNGALQTDGGEPFFIDVTVDRRQTVEALRQKIWEVAADAEPIQTEKFVLHKLQKLGAGWHIYQQVDEDLTSFISSHLSDGDKLIVWNGKLIQGEEVPTGRDNEPVLLHVKFGKGHNVAKGFPLSMTARKLQDYLCSRGNININTAFMCRVVTTGASSSIFKIFDADLDKTLKELNFENDNHVVCEDSASAAEGGGLVQREANMVTFKVENRCAILKEVFTEYPVVSQEIDKRLSVGELKAMLLSQFCVVDTPHGGGRLRIDHDFKGRSAPLHEDQSVVDAGLRHGQKLVLEPGFAPSSSEITVTLSGADLEDQREVIVEQKATLEDLLKLANINSNKYHLCHGNWLGEKGAILDDLQATLQQCDLHDNARVIVCRGTLPPKGFMILPVWLLPSKAISSVHHDASDYEPLGELTVSKQVSVTQLKEQIIVELLPQAQKPGKLRLWLLEDMRPTTLLRPNMKAKISTSSVLGAQPLDHEEDLQTGDILLNIVQSLPGTREYVPAEELLLKGAGAGGTMPLRQAVAERMDVPIEWVVLAKHWPEKYEWMLITDSSGSSGNSGGGKGKGKGGPKKKKPLLKNAPYFLADGDTIAIKNKSIDQSLKPDFSTAQDDVGIQRLKEVEEEKRKKRAESKKTTAFEIGAGDSSSKKARQEVGISIFVDNFS